MNFILIYYSFNRSVSSSFPGKKGCNMTGRVIIYRDKNGGCNMTSSIEGDVGSRDNFPNTIVSLTREIEGSKSFEWLEESAIELAELAGANLND